MELRHLRYFAAVAEDGSITRAAARLGIAQPALSQQIQSLEREVGAPLLTRHPRGVSPTEAGSRLADAARIILADVEAALAMARRTADGELGRIRVGFTGSASFHPFVSGSIRDYRAAFPELDVELVEEPTTNLLALFEARRLDVAFLRPAAGEVDHLWSRRLFDEPMVAALPAGHPLADRTAIALSDLAQDAFILYPRRNGRALHDAIIAGCAAAGFAPRVLQSAPQLTSTVNLVATGIAVSIVPASMAACAPEGVRYVAVSGAAPIAPMVLARPATPETRAAANFTGLVLARTRPA